MAKEGSNGNSHISSKPPPTPSPLRSAKFFQVSFSFLFRFFLLCVFCLTLCIFYLFCVKIWHISLGMYNVFVYFLNPLVIGFESDKTIMGRACYCFIIVLVKDCSYEKEGSRMFMSRMGFGISLIETEKEMFVKMVWERNGSVKKTMY